MSVRTTTHVEKLTPMLAQYQAIKRQYPDVILMFRLGDFYEMFGEDAHIASEVLQIALTSRPAGKDQRIPLCGVPYHQVERYVARLIAQGYRVAICDQVEDPKLAKGLVRRAVTRVITPGTVLEEGMLEAKTNNYLVVVVEKEGNYGLAVADVSTGEFAVTEVHGSNARTLLLEEIARLNPAECLLPPGSDLREAVAKIVRGRVDFLHPQGKGHLNHLPPEKTPSTPREVSLTELQAYWDSSAYQVLTQHFGTSSLRGFGCEEMELAQQAAAHLLKYLQAHQASTAEHLKSLSTYSLQSFMVIDTQTRRNLELIQPLGWSSQSRSLLQVLDKTVTPMGGRLLRRWLLQPLLDLDSIRKRLDAVEALYKDSLLRAELRDHLRRVADVERLTSRVSAGTCSPRDLANLRSSLEVIPNLLKTLRSVEAPPLVALADSMDPLPQIQQLLKEAIVEDPPAHLREGGVIRTGYHEELDRLRKISLEGKDWVARLEQQERERTGIASLKVGYNAVFGYYIEVTKPNLSRVPPDYIRKQTMVNAERFITPQLKEYEQTILGAEERALQLETTLFQEVRAKVASQSSRLLTLARALAELDVLCSLAQVAVDYHYVRPEISREDRIEIIGGRHPVVEVTNPEPFVPNDTRIGGDRERIMILTGPNMAGKSTYLRQVALITLMAHMGSFIPAERAHIGLVDRIFTRVGAQDDLASGQSTFMVEMTETANILNNATSRSLVILDEIGRGTSTYDGLSIAWAVVEYIAQIGCKTLFATHYHQLNALERRVPGIKNYRVLVKEDEHQIVWLRRVVPGGTDRSYGIQVARLAGLPDAVIQRAKEVLKSLETNGRRAPKINEQIQHLQLTFFEADLHPVLQALQEIDVNTLTPIEALNKLAELKQMLRQN